MIRISGKVCLSALSETRKETWCIALVCKRLSVYQLQRSKRKTVLSEEAQLCLKPEPGLLIRAMAISIDNPESFDVVVVRGF